MLNFVKCFLSAIIKKTMLFLTFIHWYVLLHWLIFFFFFFKLTLHFWDKFPVDLTFTFFMCFLVDLLILLMDFCIFIQDSSLSIARNQQIFSVKSQVVNIWGSADRVICVTTTQLCHCNMKAAMDNTLMDGCGSLFLRLPRWLRR